jgi:hypothetical protein
MRFPKKFADLVFARWQEHQQMADGLPTSARFIFYELVKANLILKHYPPGADGKEKKRQPAQDVSEASFWLRDNGYIPWEDISDEVRQFHDYTGYPTLPEAVAAVLEQPLGDPWNGDWPCILTESRSLAGVLYPLAEQFRVQIASVGGQCGGFLRTGIIPCLLPNQRILYLGDLDDQGEDIEANTRRVLQTFQTSGEPPLMMLRWERLLLTREQVRQFGLPSIQKVDNRFKPPRTRPATESEALGQQRIVDIVRERLAELLPVSIPTMERREQRLRQRIARFLKPASDK